jgi:hypothetical protein
MKKVSLLLSVSLVLLFGAAMASAQATKGSAAERNWNSFRPETLSGTISMIDADQNLVVLTSDNVPYNFKVTKATKIEIGGSKATFNELVNQTQKEASVTFVARRDGNFARSISISE